MIVQRLDVDDLQRCGGINDSRPKGLRPGVQMLLDASTWSVGEDTRCRKETPAGGRRQLDLQAEVVLR
jgi:hypothetical protein